MHGLVARTVNAVALSAVLLAGACAGTGGQSSARPGPSGPGRWGTAIEVPGSATLATGGGPWTAAVSISSVSCASPGDCTAAGNTGLIGSRQQPFVVSQVRGAWRKARAIPGLAALNAGHNASAGPVSCASPGDCSAGGWYWDYRHHARAFVVSEVRGTWKEAVEVPGTAALGTLSAQLSSVSCTTPGNCSAGGTYYLSDRRGQAFVVSETRGKWLRAITVPGLARLNPDGTAGLTEVSCSSPGNCSAAGTYTDTSHNTRVFVVSEVRGTWGEAIQAPGTAALGSPGVGGVSCGSAGNCAVVGYYGGQGFEYPFVENQVNGTWRSAIPVPGMAAFGQKGNGHLNAVSCAAPGDCAAAGSEGINNGFDAYGGGQPFVVTETNGTWATARLVPGVTALNTGADGGVTTLSCASAGNCSAGGYFGIGRPDQKVYDYSAFVVSEVNGVWGRAMRIPGLRALNRGKQAGVAAVSCAAAGRCSAGGSYEDGTYHGQAFVVTQGGSAG